MIHLLAQHAVLAAIVGAAGLFVGWLLRDIIATQPRWSATGAPTGWSIAAVRDELDLDWEDPRRGRAVYTLPIGTPYNEAKEFASRVGGRTVELQNDGSWGVYA